jgi:hypothetical protein
MTSERLGKRFTQVMNKDQVHVRLQTHTAQIEGQFHKKADERLLDALNLSDGFIAITDATIKPTNPAIPSHQASFLAIPRESIDWIYPVEDAE